MVTGSWLGRIGLDAAAGIRSGVRRVQFGCGTNNTSRNSSVTPTKPISREMQSTVVAIPGGHQTRFRKKLCPLKKYIASRLNSISRKLFLYLNFLSPEPPCIYFDKTRAKFQCQVLILIHFSTFLRSGTNNLKVRPKHLR